MLLKLYRIFVCLQFLKFMNHKKSRLTDLFRKMDKNNDGLIPRDDFIDGIIKTSKCNQFISSFKHLLFYPTNLLLPNYRNVKF